MPRGKMIGNLVNYNTKLEEDFKDLLEALAVVKSGISSQRELLHAMAEAYERENQDAFAAAREYVAKYKGTKCTQNTPITTPQEMTDALNKLYGSHPEYGENKKSGGGR